MVRPQSQSETSARERKGRATMSNSQGNFTAKQVTIVVNGRERQVDKDQLTYQEVLALAFDPVPSGPNVYFTVTYRRGHGDKPEGTLAEGGVVKVKEGMIFNVSQTDKS